MNKVLSHRIQKLLREKKDLLVGYFLLGYPNKEDFLDILRNIDNTKLDILEIGFPSSDPYFDGSVIRNAHSRVDSNIAKDIEYFKSVREATNKPIWLMAYKHDFIDSKIYKLLIKENLIDAIVIPDCSYDERKQLATELANYNVDIVGFIRPDMNEKELELVLSNFSLIYAQLHTGKTGMLQTKDDFEFMLRKSQKYKDVTIFAGFGINNKQRVMELINRGFHGTIIGTEMVRKLNNSKEELIRFINHIKAV